MIDFAHVLCGCSSRFSTFAFSLTDDEMGSGYRDLRGHCERPDDSDPLAFKMVPQVLPLDLRAPTLRGPRPIHCLHDFRLARAAPRCHSLASSTSALLSTAISGIHFLQPPFCHLPAYSARGIQFDTIMVGRFYMLGFMTLGPPFTWMLRSEQRSTEPRRHLPPEWVCTISIWMISVRVCRFNTRMGPIDQTF